MGIRRCLGSVAGVFALGSLACGTIAANPEPNPPAPTEQTSGGVTVIGETPAKTATTGKITDPKHPDFVRCRSEPVLNSRAARLRVCRTNKEWAASSREGNRQTQELLNMGRPTQPTP